MCDFAWWVLLETPIALPFTSFKKPMANILLSNLERNPGTSVRQLRTALQLNVHRLVSVHCGVALHDFLQQSLAITRPGDRAAVLLREAAESRYEPELFEVVNILVPKAPGGGCKLVALVVVVVGGGGGGAAAQQQQRRMGVMQEYARRGLRAARLPKNLVDHVGSSQRHPLRHRRGVFCQDIVVLLEEALVGIEVRRSVDRQVWRR